MNRRSFFRRTLSGFAAIALSQYIARKPINVSAISEVLTPIEETRRRFCSEFSMFKSRQSILPTEMFKMLAIESLSDLWEMVKRHGCADSHKAIYLMDATGPDMDLIRWRFVAEEGAESEWYRECVKLFGL